jgi:hypothetical protein
MAAIEAAKGGEGPLGPFLNHPTLRAGDVVVTAKGFMMFRGEESQSHRETDFVSIANPSGLAANKKALISLESASHLTPRKREEGRIVSKVSLSDSDAGGDAPD